MKKNAIVVYIDADEKIIKEFGWLFKSWQMWSIEKTWDIIAFTNPDVIEEVKSTYVHENVKFVEMEPVSKEYPYLNSYGMFEDDANLAIVNKYDFLFKTDCDTFLTKHFVDFNPWKDKVYCGIGLYANSLDFGDAIRAKLRIISKTLGLQNHGHSHIGASLIAKTDILINISKYQVLITNYLLKNMFKDGDGAWPSWYKGVAALYAHDIAINHIVSPLQLNQGSIDVWCTLNNITSLDLHIHAWHVSDDVFNKKKWHNGELPNIKFGYIPKASGEYCLLVANENIEHLKKLV